MIEDCKWDQSQHVPDRQGTTDPSPASPRHPVRIKCAGTPGDDCTENQRGVEAALGGGNNLSNHGDREKFLDDGAEPKENLADDEATCCWCCSTDNCEYLRVSSRST